MKVKLFRYILVVIGLVFGAEISGQELNIDSCLQVLKTSKEDTNKVILLDHIAWDISYSNLQKGIDYSIESYELAKKLNFERIYSRIFNTQGAIYTDMAETAKALELFLEGVKYSKKYNQAGVESALYNSLGNLYSRRGDSKKALSYYLQSVETAKKSNSKKGGGYVAYTNIVGIYTSYKMLDSAMYFANLSLEFNLKNNIKSRLINNYISLSEIYYEKNDKFNCLKNAEKAVAIAIEINDIYTLSHAYIQLSDAQYLNGKINQAIESLKLGYQLADSTGDVSAKETATKYLSMLYEETDDYKSSLHFYKEYKSLKDSVWSFEGIQQMKNAEAKFETDKKQKEIELLAEKQKLNEAENQRKKSYLIFAVFGIIILGFVLVILYRNNVLKQKTNKNLEAFNKEINHQKELIEVKNKEIVDSINYAKRIQQSILTSHQYFKNNTDDFFILFKPKDIVSGDFYWALNYENKFIVMTADCTGHGVPGAMMSMMGINFLNEIVNEKGITSPALVLNQLRSDIIKTLNPEGSDVESKDGMDCSFCSFDFNEMKLTYANANNNFYVIRDKELIVSSVDKMPVGAGHSVNVLFREFVMDIKKGDLVITFTDGYADQFGGDKGKKFKYKQLESLLFSNAHLPLNDIQTLMNDTIETWRGNLEQVDDICVIGIKV